MVAAQSQRLPTAMPSFAHILAECVKRLSTLGPASRSACPPAWELAGITRIDRFDIAPWLSL